MVDTGCLISIGWSLSSGFESMGKGLHVTGTRNIDIQVSFNPNLLIEFSKSTWNRYGAYRLKALHECCEGWFNHHVLQDDKITENISFFFLALSTILKLPCFDISFKLKFPWSGWFFMRWVRSLSLIKYMIKHLCFCESCPKSCFIKFHKNNRVLELALPYKGGMCSCTAIGYNVKSADFNSYIQFYTSGTRTFNWIF